MLATGNAPPERFSPWEAPETSADSGVLAGLPVSRYVQMKGAVDIVLAAVMLVFAAPFMLLAAVLVKLTSRGPVFYTQTRLGKDGTPYPIFKIRTMRHDCEKVSGPQWSQKGDPRITLVGRFLRKTHLDELPQLWNVLRGEMSLVGPRPERPEFAVQLERALPNYNGRLRVKPGVTGLAQIQLEADTDLNSVRRKLIYDLYYIRRISWLLDAQIILSTGFKVLHVPFFVSRFLFRVPGANRIEPPDEGAEIESAPQLQSA